jgi:hypothetical protein
MRTPVRATRAYLAGLGTSGSLLAGAALLFVLGSAIVAFRGWPQIATGPATSAVAVPRAPAPSRVARRLAAVIALRTSRTGGGTAAAHARPHSVSARGPGKRVQSVAGAAAPGAGGAEGSAGGAGVAGVAGVAAGGSGAQGAVTRLANAVAQGVSDAGSTVSSQVHGGGNAVAGPVGGVSPPAAGAVQSGGGAATNAVSGATSTVASTVTQVGTALGSGH